MIGSLNGELTHVAPPTVLVECGGVGYEVWIPASAFGGLPALGGTLRLHTVLVVRDDAHTLYGFPTPEERSLFNLLTRISGIGAKSALALLSSFDVNDFSHAVLSNNSKALTRAPGIGRKTAERIILELRGSDLLASAPSVTPALGQAMEALVALGYPVAAARSALAKIDAGGMDVAALVKAGLAELSGGGKS